MTLDPSGLLTITDAYGPFKLPCGGFEWGVTHHVGNAHKGGRVVQQVDITKWDVKVCQTDEVVPKPSSYPLWETYPGPIQPKEDRPPSSKLPIEKDGKKMPSMDDFLSLADMPNKYGSYMFEVVSKFYEGQMDIPPGFFKPGEQGHVAITLSMHSTQKEPPIWKEKATDEVSNYMIVTWNCCYTNKTCTANASPKGREVPPKPK